MHTVKQLNWLAMRQVRPPHQPSHHPHNITLTRPQQRCRLRSHAQPHAGGGWPLGIVRRHQQPEHRIAGQPFHHELGVAVRRIVQHLLRLFVEHLHVEVLLNAAVPAGHAGDVHRVCGRIRGATIAHRIGYFGGHNVVQARRRLANGVLRLARDRAKVLEAVDFVRVHIVGQMNGSGLLLLLLLGDGAMMSARCAGRLGRTGRVVLLVRLVAMSRSVTDCIAGVHH